jgi:CubicO group peptidase (beta-lactamase class C family)
MRSKIVASIFFLTLFLQAENILLSQIDVVNNKNLTQSQRDLITKYVSGFPENTQLSMAFITNNKVNYVGIEKVGSKLLLINNRDSVFEIGSITKLFTSTILANLIKENVLILNDPIETVLPYKLSQYVKDRKLITYNTLANHTSGLPRMPDNYIPGYDSALLRIYLQRQLSLNSVPGEKYQYSNLGVGILGYLMEIKTGKSYEELLHDKIFLEYNMNFTTSEFNKIKDLVVPGRDSSGNIIPNWRSDVLKAAGGILSNVTDLSKYVFANFSNDSILSFQREKTYTTEYQDLALGWHILKFGGNTCSWYYHNGGMDGYRSALFMDLNIKSAVIILSNVSGYHPQSGNIDKLCDNLLKQLLIAQTSKNSSLCEAPFIEMALVKGWGTNKNDSIQQLTKSDTSIIGVWQKQNSSRIITRTFIPNNKVQSDFSGDPEIDIWGYYHLNGNNIEFRDIGGAACNNLGLYKYNLHDNKLSFSLIKDSCDGRTTGLSGIWTRKK